MPISPTSSLAGSSSPISFSKTCFSPSVKWEGISSRERLDLVVAKFLLWLWNGKSAELFVIREAGILSNGRFAGVARIVLRGVGQEWRALAGAEWSRRLLAIARVDASAREGAILLFCLRVFSDRVSFLLTELVLSLRDQIRQAARKRPFTHLPQNKFFL